MKMLVLGAGLQGSACAYDLLQHAGVERVTLADLPGTPLAPFLVPFAGDRLQLQTLDVTDQAAVRVYVKRKLQRRELSARERLPPIVDDIATERRQIRLVGR